MKSLKPFAFACCAALAMSMTHPLYVYADSPAWPADFWTQVSNHVEAVAPAGAQIATATRSMYADQSTLATSPAYGTVALPFSTFNPFVAESDWTTLDTGSVGTMIFVW